MDMIEVRTSDLVGAALRYALVVAAGGRLKDEHAPLEGKDYQRVCLPAGYDDHGLWFESVHPAWAGTAGARIWRPDEDWSQGGPLIEKYGVALSAPYKVDPTWDAYLYSEDDAADDFEAEGCSTALVAVCRVIVASKLGDVVQVPSQLVTT